MGRRRTKRNEIFFVWCKSISTFSNRVLYYHDLNKENKETATHQSHRLLTNCKISYFPFFLWYMVNKIVSQMGLVKKKLKPIWTLFDSVEKKEFDFFFGKYLLKCWKTFCRFRNRFYSKCNDYVNDGRYFLACFFKS